MAIDMDKLQEFLGRFVYDLGATFAAGNVVIGHRLGLYRALAARPADAAELAGRTAPIPATSPSGCAARRRGYVGYDAATDTFSMTEEQAFALAEPDGGVYVPGAFVLALGTLKAEPRITEAFRTGAGMGWHEQDADVFIGCEQFFRPGYIANLIPSWIPALDEVEDKLRAGARVADIGCGLGASTILMAQEYPNSRFPARTTTPSRSRSPASGPPTPVSRTGSVSRSPRRLEFSGTGYDLVATFDCLHDMGDPLAAARHIREALAGWHLAGRGAVRGRHGGRQPQPGGAGLLQRVDAALRAQRAVPAWRLRPRRPGGRGRHPAGHRRPGFTRFRRAAETPFNLVYEVRP